MSAAAQPFEDSGIGNDQAAFAELLDDSRDQEPADIHVRCTRGERRRVYLMAARLGVKPAKLVRKHLFERKMDPFFSETLRSIAVKVRVARMATGPSRAGQLEMLETHILDLIADYNRVVADSSASTED